MNFFNGTFKKRLTSYWIVLLDFVLGLFQQLFHLPSHICYQQEPLAPEDEYTCTQLTLSVPNVDRLYNQMGVQVYCGCLLITDNHFIFHMLPCTYMLSVHLSRPESTFWNATFQIRAKSLNINYINLLILNTFLLVSILKIWYFLSRKYPLVHSYDFPYSQDLCETHCTDNVVTKTLEPLLTATSP